MQKATKTHLGFILAASIVVMAPDAAAKELGLLRLGESSYFETVAGVTYRVEAGIRSEWATPTAGGKMVQVENGATDGMVTPFAVMESGDLYQADVVNRSWILVGKLPGVGHPVESTDLLAADLFHPGYLYWAWDRKIYASSNSGRSWKPIGESDTPVHRLVLTPEQDLVAISESGFVVRGKIHVTEDGTAGWNYETIRVSAREAQNVRVLPDDGLALRNQSGEWISWSGRERSERGERGERGDSGLMEPDGEQEFSMRNVTNVGCHWQVHRRDPRTGHYRHDNYWDVNANGHQLDLQMVLVSGSRNCVWSAPFRPVRVTIMDSAFTRRMDRGGAGRIGVRIQSNDLSVPLVRAVAFNVRNPSHYTSPPLSQVLTKATEDCWVVIVQNSRNGRTACEAFWNAPSHDEARRSGRKFLRVPLFGSNPYCPAVSTAAIPCVSQLPGSRISSMDTDAVSSVPWELRLASRGMGECVLPDLD